MNEEFEKWWNSDGWQMDDTIVNMMYAAFLAGMEAEKERCAKVAWRYLLDYYGRAAADKVAALIREGGE